MRKCLIIYNSLKANNYFTKHLSELIIYLSKNDYEVKVKATVYKNDIEQTITEIDDVDLLCLSGGDGTMHQCVNAISKLIKKPQILYFPTGTVNDFAFSLSLKHSIIEGIKLLEDEFTLNIDSAKINDRYFNYVCAFGSVTKASYSVTHEMKNNFGSLAYVFSSLAELPNITNSTKMEITINNDEVITDEFVLGVISNSSSVAGMRTLFKDNKFDDGEFELFFLTKQNILSLKAFGNLIYNGGVTDKINDTNCLYRKVKSVSIKCSDDIIWTIDGEKGPQGNIDIEIIKHNYQIYAPKEKNELI